MKRFRSIVPVKHPADLVWRTVRDRLPELIAMVDDIESVTVVTREVRDTGAIRLVNEWRSIQRPPALLRKQLGDDAIGWIDRNEWDDATRVCRWRIEPSVLPTHIDCEGQTDYEPSMGGRGARVTFQGSFSLAPGAVPGLGVFEQPLNAFVESIVTTLIPRNFRKVLHAASDLIRSER